MKKKSLLLFLSLCSYAIASSSKNFIYQRDACYFYNFDLTEKNLKHHPFSLKNNQPSSLKKQFLKKLIKITDKEFEDEIKKSGKRHYLNKKNTYTKIKNLFKDYEETHEFNSIKKISIDLITIDTAYDSRFFIHRYMITKAIISKLKINDSEEEPGYLFFSSYPLLDI